MRDCSWQGFAATVFDVNQKGWRPEWEVEKLGGKLVMRLHKGDAIEVNDADGVRRMKTVHRLKSRAIASAIWRLTTRVVRSAKRHDDKDDPFRWDFASIVWDEGPKGQEGQSSIRLEAQNHSFECRFIN